MILIVSLSYGEANTSPEMVEYRRLMQPVLLKYGGERISSLRVLPSQPDDPRAIHLTRFPSKGEFDAMQADPDYQALEALRQATMPHLRTYVTEEYVTFLD